jgi:hypothetical protein
MLSADMSITCTRHVVRCAIERNAALQTHHVEVPAAIPRAHVPCQAAPIWYEKPTNQRIFIDLPVFRKVATVLALLDDNTIGLIPEDSIFPIVEVEHVIVSYGTRTSAFSILDIPCTFRSPD